jgi:hypothetical protein
VRLGRTTGGSISAAVFAFVERGAALGRLADGRIEFEGPLRLARGVLHLMSALPEKPRSRSRRPARHEAHDRVRP